MQDVCEYGNMRAADRSQVIAVALKVTSFHANLPTDMPADLRQELDAVNHYVLHGIWLGGDFPQDMKKHFEHLQKLARTSDRA